MKRKTRIDRTGQFQNELNKNKKKIYATQTICGICGNPVDFSLKWPDPLSPTIDHIVPVAKGGHPSDIDNLQLSHAICNRTKSDKIQIELRKVKEPEYLENNNNLPLSLDWETYRADG